eukprot:jgi/Tetstr1/455837/TSEL_042628.t1
MASRPFCTGAAVAGSAPASARLARPNAASALRRSGNIRYAAAHRRPHVLQPYAGPPADRDVACPAAMTDALSMVEDDSQLLVHPLEPVAVAATVGTGAEAAVAAEVASSTVGFRQILRFVLPTLGIWITNPILSLVDTAVVGQVSAVELAALGPGVLLCDHSAYWLTDAADAALAVVADVFNFLAIATANLLAVAFASGSKSRTEAVMNESLMAALLMGAACGAAYFAFAPQCIALMAGVGGAALVGPATQYVQIRALGLAAVLISSVLQCFFLAARNPVTPMISVLAAGGLNLVGDLLLCNVFRMGIVGAALATTAAQLVACALLVAAILRRQPDGDGAAPCGWKLNLRASLPSLAVVLRLARFAGPVGLVLLTKVAMYTLLTGPVASTGTISTGAHHLTFTVFMFFVVIGDAVSMACQAFLPSRIGHPQQDPQALGNRLIVTGAVVGVVNSLIASAILLFGAGIFVSDPAVAATVAKLVPVVAATLFVHTCSMATEGIMLAGRKYFYLVSTYLANCGLVYATYHWALAMGLGQLMAVWWGIFTFQAVRMLINLAVLATPYSVLKATRPLEVLKIA